MMAKIVKGTDFRGCVNYVTRASKDLPDGKPCNDWRIIGTKEMPQYGGREEIISVFEDNQALNPKIKNVVGHISLNFHANDKDKISDKLMVEITAKYMERMGIVDTPCIVVRHLDKDYPHCHIVFSRVNNHGEVISDKNDFARNRRVCLNLTREYGLHISEGKHHTNVNRLRGVEKIRYEIFNAVSAALHDSNVRSFADFEAYLKANGVGIEYKYRRGTNEIQGLTYIRKGKRFAASKIDRRFSYGNILKNFLQKKAATSTGFNNAIPSDHNRQVATDRTQYYRSSPQVTTPDDERCHVGGGGGETFKQFYARHPELTYSEAVRRFRAKKRGQNFNGGFHI